MSPKIEAETQGLQRWHWVGFTLEVSAVTGIQAGLCRGKKNRRHLGVAVGAMPVEGGGCNTRTLLIA